MAKRAYPQLGATVPQLGAWRVRRTMNQGELARAAGVSRFTVQRAERGESISFASIRKLAAALKVSPDDLRAETRTNGC